MKRVKFTFFIFTFLFLSFNFSFSTTYQVGPGKTYSNFASLPALSAGDIIEVYYKTYNEYKAWTSSGTLNNPIIIRGIGELKPLIDGTGLNLKGSGGVPRALFEFSGSYYIIENLEFKNADNTSEWGDNAAGIRVNGGNNITIRNCKITNCENGIFSNNCSNLVVEYCEIAENGSLDPGGLGYTHNFYLNGTSGIVRYCYIHDSKCGHNLKSRLHYIEVLYNYITNANSAEVDIVDSSDTLSTNSNAVLIGNIIKKRDSASPFTPGNDSQFIVFGQDIGGNRNGTLYMINNTVVAGMSSNKFLYVNATSSRAILYNNIFYGSDNIFYDSNSISKTTGYNNWIPQTANNPSVFNNTIFGTNPGFLGNNDYHLNSASTCINAGYSNPIYIDGSGVSNTGVPEYEYVHSLSFVTRAKDGQLDIGAYEYGTVIPISGGGSDPFVNTKVYPNPFRISESFNKGVKIIDIPMNSRIEIYNISGDRIRILNSNFSYGVIWDGKDDKGEYVPFGVYNYVIFDTLGNKKKGKIGFIK